MSLEIDRRKFCGLTAMALGAFAPGRVGWGAPGHTPAARWPQWRGPTSQGLVEQPQLGPSWPSAKPRLLWEATVGGGWSSPVVADGRVFINDRIHNRERVVALDLLTGKQLWAVEHDVDFDPHAVGRRHGNGPKSTPVVSDGKVYSLGIAGWLECLDAATGRREWHVHYPAEYGEREPLADGRAYVNGETNVIVPVGNGQGAPVPLFGYTGSLVSHGELLISPVGGARAGTIQAFHKDTGRVVWRALDENVSYSSPIIANLVGVWQLVAMTGPRVVGLELATGKLLWSHAFQIQYDESIATPVVSGDRVLVTGDGHPLTALEITAPAGRWNARVAWENDELTSYIASPVVHAGHVYGTHSAGHFACVRVTDGQTAWTGERHGFYCAPLVESQRIIALNEQGELLVLAADASAYRMLAKHELFDTATWTSPAVAASRLVLRGFQRLRCFDTA